MKSNFLGKFRAAAARYLFPSQSAAAAVASPAQSAAVALSPLRSGVDNSSSSKLKPQSTWGIVVISVKTAFVIERFGKYAKTLTTPGPNILIPFVDKIAYVQSMRDRSIKELGQVAITKDGVPLRVDAYFYFEIFDPVLASYNVENVRYSVTELARKTMVTEIGKRTCEEAAMEMYSTLTDDIRSAINEVAKDWGLNCFEYGIRDLHLPAVTSEAMAKATAKARELKAYISIII